MSRSPIPARLKSLVRNRAKGRCEYCRMPESGSFFPHEPDHIIAAQHGGAPIADNLALACIQRNRFKGPNIASVDPESRSIVPLFNPRTNRWDEHFRPKSGRIVPLTPIGRATAMLLKFNDPERVEARHKLSAVEHYAD